MSDSAFAFTWVLTRLHFCPFIYSNSLSNSKAPGDGNLSKKGEKEQMCIWMSLQICVPFHVPRYYTLQKLMLHFPAECCITKGNQRIFLPGKGSQIFHIYRKPEVNL